MKLGAAILLVCIAACGSKNLPANETTDDSDAGAPPGIGGDQPAANDDNCSAAAKLVYVISGDSDLYSFTPDTQQFAKIGKLACPALAGTTPNSMAVDRSGTAWVNYTDGGLYKASTVDATCQASGFRANQAGFNRFGMAFVTDGTSTNETLYIAGLNDLKTSLGYGLGKIDLTTLTLTMIGDYGGTLTGLGAELTGTGDGKLYGFFTTDPATLAVIDPTTGAASSLVPLPGVETQDSWAFSFYGGNFFYYTAPKLGSSALQKSSPTGDVSQLATDVGGFQIVGAGVSTCAPISGVK